MKDQLQQSQLLSDVGHQGHKSSALDSFRYSVLADCSTAVLASSNNSAVTIDQLGQQVDIFVVDVHWIWTLAINKQRVFSLDLDSRTRAASHGFRLLNHALINISRDTTKLTCDCRAVSQGRSGQQMGGFDECPTYEMGSGVYR